MMDKAKIEAVYDKLCKVLTEYEDGNGNTGDLYNTMVEAVNDLEELLY